MNQSGKSKFHIATLLKSLDNDFYKKYIKSDLNIDFYDYVEFCHLLNEDIEYYTLFDKVKLIALINREQLWEVFSFYILSLLVIRLVYIHFSIQCPCPK